MLLKCLLFVLGVAGVFGEYLSPSHHRQLRSANRLCKYGNRYDCCRGYKKNLYGQCIPQCDQGCDNGKCIGYNRCKCNPGYTGKSCNRDHNECSARPCQHRCMNTFGSYRCYCEHGFLLMSDGKSCAKDDKCHNTRCAFGCVQYLDGFQCFCPDGLKVTWDGLGCEDVDECKDGTHKCSKERRCQNTYGNFICLCQEGFKFQYVDRKLICVDEDECDANMCHTNARCQNRQGSYRCICNEGFIGNGKQCKPLDPTTCEDGPCYPGVECTNIRILSARDIELTPEGAVKQFRCGMCPEGFLGTGEACAPTTTEMKVVVFESIGNQEPLANTKITALEVQSPGVTEKFAAATTGSNGVATLNVPNDAQRLILTASKLDYLETARSFEIRPNEENTVVLFMSEFNEINDFAESGQARNFEFGGAEGTNNFRLGLPAGVLNVPRREKIAVRLLDIDISNPASLSHVPELTGIIRENGQVREVQLEIFGVAELTMFKLATQEVPELNKPVIIQFPMDIYGDRFEAGDQIEAWYFDIDTGYWIQDGYGTLEQTDVGFVWTYEASHFTWWSAAQAIPDFQCVDVRACYDSLCTKTASNIKFQLTGLGYNFFATKSTSSSGAVTFKYKHNSIAQVKQNCTGATKTVSGGTKLTALGDSGPCEEITFIVPASLDGKCPDPGTPDNGVKRGDDYSFGQDVTYFCDPEYDIHGSSRRVCLECGKWSGYKPFCEETSDYSSSWMIRDTNKGNDEEGSGEFGLGFP